jgi:hypothetical protein
MTVDKVYSILKFIVRKNQLGSLSPDDFAYAFNTAQRNYYDFLVGRIEQYQYGRAVSRVGLSMTDNVVSRLMPFESSVFLNNINSTSTTSVAIPTAVGTSVTFSTQTGLSYTAGQYLRIANDATHFFDASVISYNSSTGSLVTSSLSNFGTGTFASWTIGGGVTLASGLLTATKPINFNKLLSIYTQNNFRVYRIEENRFAERMQDSIDPVDEANAFYVEQNTNWRIYPTSLTTLTLKYLTVPTDVVWAYTLDGSGRPVYASSGSVDPLWKDNDIDELVGRAAKIIGVSFKEPTLSQFGQGVINTGE